MANVCFSCRKELDITGRPGRGETCPFCGSDVKVCLNCAFYDESAYNECREPQADRVLDKDRANFCDYFEFREASGKKSKKGKKGEKAQVEAGDALNKLKKLFKDT
jgi:hypothetical protein